jgi:hypothetical protein
MKTFREIMKTAEEKLDQESNFNRTHPGMKVFGISDRYFYKILEELFDKETLEKMDLQQIKDLKSIDDL